MIVCDLDGLERFLRWHRRWCRWGVVLLAVALLTLWRLGT